MILGSSRAEKIQPSQLRRLTGLTGFNAAVSSGTPDDAWSFANLLHAKAGDAQQRVLWLLDVESMRRRPIDPALLDTPSLARCTVVRVAPSSTKPARAPRNGSRESRSALL